MSQLSEVEVRGVMNSSFLYLLFYSVLCRLDDLHTMVEGQGSLACCSPWDHKRWTRLVTEQPPPQWEAVSKSIPVQMLIPPGNILQRKHPRTMFNLGTCGSLQADT